MYWLFSTEINLIRSFLTLKPDLVISDATLKLCQIFGISLLVLGYQSSCISDVEKQLEMPIKYYAAREKK